jgi:hypothetical protein
MYTVPLSQEVVYTLDIWRPQVYSISCEYGGMYSGQTGGSSIAGAANTPSHLNLSTEVMKYEFGCYQPTDT